MHRTSRQGSNTQRERTRFRNLLRQIQSEHTVPLSQYFSPAFMRQHTRFHNFDEFLAAYEAAERPMDLQGPAPIPGSPAARTGLERFVRTNTPFACWSEMKKSAAGDWVKFKTQEKQSEKETLRGSAHYWNAIQQFRKFKPRDETVCRPDDKPILPPPTLVYGPPKHPDEVKNKNLTRVLLTNDGSVRELQRADPRVYELIQQGQRFRPDLDSENDHDRASNTLAPVPFDLPEFRQREYEPLNLAPIQGALMVLGGISEVVTGLAMVLTPEPATTVIGFVVLAHGFDSLYTGFLILDTGTSQRTNFSKGTQWGLEGVGVDPAYAEFGGEAADIGVGLLTLKFPQARSFVRANEIELLSTARGQRFYQGWGARIYGVTDGKEPGVAVSAMEDWAHYIGRGNKVPYFEDGVWKGVPTLGKGVRDTYTVSGTTKAMTVPDKLYDTLGAPLRLSGPEVADIMKTRYETVYPRGIIPPEVHAESQLIADNPLLRVISMNTDAACPQCQRVFYQQANRLNRDVLAETPKGIYVFKPGKIPPAELEGLMSNQKVREAMAKYSTEPIFHKGLTLPAKFKRFHDTPSNLILLPVVGQQLSRLLEMSTRYDPNFLNEMQQITQQKDRWKDETTNENYF